MYSMWALEQPKQKGFTIVELLLVVAIIGILAIITVVAYTGIANASKTSSAKASAHASAKKVGIYATETGSIPLLSTDLTSAGALSTTYYLPGVTFGTPAASAVPSTMLYRKCGSGTPATQSAVTAGTITAVRIVYWDYTAGNANSYITYGTDTGGTVACPVAP